jgi:hypothetical protein
MQKELLGVHSEWNMGSPGGWDYQRMAQQIGKLAWKRIREASKIKIDLDFDAPILNPVPHFAELLLRAHRRMHGNAKPFIALIAEEETLDKVGENIRFVDYLNSLPGVAAILAGPDKLEARKGDIYIGDKKVTLVFLDFNNSIIVKLRKEKKGKGLMKAIERGIVTNPRGMEPVGAKGVFEVVTADYKEMMSETTRKRTPWTRQFYPRETTGPHREKIPDLIRWAKENWPGIVLKPVHGYSGKGIIIGHKESDIEGSLRKALTSGDYIIQPLIPLDLWAEEFPWIDREKKRLFIKRWQTDFRCFVTDAGLIGFVTRFGGIPTNVGSGGGVQCAAILRSDIRLRDAISIINETILDLGFELVWELQQEMNKKSIEIGNIYLLGPIMSTLRPRIITEHHIGELRVYADNLWRDAMKLEELWLAGKLSQYVQISPEEESIARLAPWRGKPALIAADGLFGFV